MVYTVSTVAPLGVASLENAVDPLYARSNSPPESTFGSESQNGLIKQTRYALTAENVEAITPLPQEKTPDETLQLPFVEVIVKLDVVPDKVYILSV